MTPDPIALPKPGQAAWPKRTESVTASAILADIPPPPPGWAIVPAEDPRLDCLPVRPMFYSQESKRWYLSHKGAGDKAGKRPYALPIEPAIPPLVTVALPNGSTTTIHAAEQARGMKIDRVVKWHRIPNDEERAAVVAAMAAWNSPNPASPDPKGEAGKAKAPLWLLPPEAMRQAAWAHGLGAAKYRAWNWRENKVQASTYISAMMRHIAAYLDGEDNDAETSAHAGQPVSHLANVIASANILLDAQAHGTLIDDRPPARASRGPEVPD